MPESIAQIKFPGLSTHNARRPNGNKWLVQYYDVIAFDRNAAPSRPDNGFTVPIQVSCWMSPSSSSHVVYAAVWVFGRALGDYKSWSGSGKAGGYGYDKVSAAIDSAIRNAGIILPYHFGGAGEGKIKNALEDIAAALGYTTFYVHSGG